MNDPFDTDEWRAYVERVNHELVPMIDKSAFTVSLAPRSGVELDIKFSLELGLSIMLDKPLIVIVFPGSPVPAKLMQVADQVIEGSLDDPTMRKRLVEAIHRVMKARS